MQGPLPWLLKSNGVMSMLSYHSRYRAILRPGEEAFCPQSYLLKAPAIRPCPDLPEVECPPGANQGRRLLRTQNCRPGT